MIELQVLGNDAIPLSVNSSDAVALRSTTPPVDGVISVNGKQGVVTLTAEDIEGSGVPTNVRQAIYTLLNSGAYATTGLTDEIAIVESWAEQVTALTISPTTLSLSNNTPQTITATVVPSGSTVSWSSSDTSVATVVAGVVTGVGNGECVITATAGDISRTCAVTVSGFATLESISAVYTQGGTITNVASLDDLRTDLVVTATWSDSSTSVITDYLLSGSLTVGTATITASYEGKSDTFNVTVTDSGYLYYWDFTESLTDRVNGTVAVLNNISANGVTSDGIVFSLDNLIYDTPSRRQGIILDNVFGRGKCIEIDLKNVSLTTDGTSRSVITLWDGVTRKPSGSYNSFGYHYSATASNNRYGIVTSDQGHWGYPTTSSVGTTTYLNGNCTVKMTIDSSGNIAVYKDGTDMNIKYSSASMTITDANAKNVVIGAYDYSYESDGGYANIKDATISGVRIKNL